MQVAILLVSVIAEESLQSTVALIKTVDSDEATMEYVSNRLIEDQHAQKLIMHPEKTGRLAAAATKRRSSQS